MRPHPARTNSTPSRRAGRPCISVVIPTRNRPELLRHALATALAPATAGLEVVVSDNGTGPEARRVVEAASDPRVRYVRPDRELAAHDHWEFALARARGDWLTVLPDDDGFVPSLLARVTPLLDGTVRAVAWREGFYTHPGVRAGWLEDSEVNRVVAVPGSGRVEEVNARRELERLYRRRETLPAPGLVGSLVRRDLVEAVRGATGRVFPPPDPFIGAAVAVMALEPTYVAVDAPLTLRGVSAATITFGLIHNDTEGHEVVREFAGGIRLDLVPFPWPLSTNVVAESLLQARRHPGLGLEGVEHDVVRYFVLCREELDDARRHPDGGRARRAWIEALAHQPRPVRSAVRRALAERRTRNRTARWVRSRARRVPGARSVHRRLGGPEAERGRWVTLDGEPCGFTDLPSAAAYVDAHLLAPLIRPESRPTATAVLEPAGERR